MKQPPLTYLHRLQNEKPMLTFAMLADLHITLPRRNAHLEAALEDIWHRQIKQVAILGDFTNNGYNFQWKACLQQLKEYPLQYAIALGNHDLYNYKYHNSMHLHPLYRSMILQDHTHIYYDVWWNDIHIYVLNSQHPDKSNAIFYEDQLEWLQNTLKKDDAHKPVLVFCHHPLAHTHAYSNTLKQTIGFQSDRIAQIIKSYPNVLFFSAHLHNDASLCKKRFDGCFLIDVPAFHQVENGEKQKGYGYEVQLYHDFVYIQTRDYLKQQWMASQGCILSISNHHIYALDEACLMMQAPQ